MTEPAHDRRWTASALASRLVRYGDLIPCTTAFLDTRTPGSDRKENFTIIGPGVAENPDQHVHIDVPHGFNIGAARQPPGCVNSQHSHETAEVFVVHSGRWAFHAGECAEDAEVLLGAGDTISIPTHVFRGFTNVGEETGFMFAVLGEDDPGRVTWAPSVFADAAAHGMVLLDNGGLVDRAKGERIPDGAAPMAPTTAADVARMRRLDAAALANCAAPAKALRPAPRSSLSAPGVAEFPIIGGPRADGMPAGKLDWRHGFQLRKLVVQPGAATALHRRPQEEVLLCHRGALSLVVDGSAFNLAPGDVMSVPVGLARRYANEGDTPCEIYAVDGGDEPQGAAIEDASN